MWNSPSLWEGYQVCETCLTLDPVHNFEQNFVFFQMFKVILNYG